MNYWNQTPLFRLLPFFIAGILLNIFAGLPQLPITQLVLLILMSSMILGFIAFRKRAVYRLRWIFGIGVYLFSFLAGWLITALQHEPGRPDHFSSIHAQVYAGTIDENPVEKEKSVKAIIEIFSVKDSAGWQTARGRIRVTFRKNKESLHLQYGDRILFAQLPNEIRKPENPEQFDARRYLMFQQVTRQVFLDSGQWKLESREKGNPLIAFANTLRFRMLRIFSEHYIDGQDYAVLSALLLGYEEDIDQDVYRAYAATGVLHVLSVSGLHVGIVYIALNFFLFFLDRSRSGKRWKALIILLFLWFYALLTGLQPSVLRAAAMLSFAVIGSLMERRTNLYNTLAASAFLLLAWDPYLLMQVGFQLSYLAVFGIVFLYPKIFHWFYLKNRFLKAVWSLTAVSVAAQLATFPLGLMYFHQFPNYFLLSNMLIIPISTVVIYGGIFLLAISPFTVVANYVGYLVGLLVHGLNLLVLQMETLPYGSLNGIFISAAETGLIYLMILGIVLFLVHLRSAYLFASLGIAILLFAWNIVEFAAQQKQRLLIVFSVPRQSAVNFVDGSQSVLLADSSLYNHAERMSFYMVPFWWKIGIDERFIAGREKNSSSKNLLIWNSVAKFYDKIVLVVDSDFYFSEEALLPGGFDTAQPRDRSLSGVEGSEALEIDFMILSQNSRVALRPMLKKAKPKLLIIDSSNSFYKEEQWTKVAKEFGVPVYSVLRNGAFVYSLNENGMVECWKSGMME